GLQRLAALLHAGEDAAHVAGDRARLQRRGHLAFTELAAGGVGQRGAEVFRLADDARVAHAHELEAHLDGDVLQRALDDGAGYRIDTGGDGCGGLGRGVHVRSPNEIRMLPDGWTTAVVFGGMTV